MDGLIDVLIVLIDVRVPKSVNVTTTSSHHTFRYIVPVLNPDGYEYTFTGDRMWRKTRKPSPGNRCPGADPNRNWDSAFGTTGVSRNPCSDTYPGPHAFSGKSQGTLVQILTPDLMVSLVSIEKKLALILDAFFFNQE